MHPMSSRRVAASLAALTAVPLMIGALSGTAAAQDTTTTTAPVTTTTLGTDDHDHRAADDGAHHHDPSDHHDDTGPTHDHHIQHHHHYDHTDQEHLELQDVGLGAVGGGHRPGGSPRRPPDRADPAAGS